MKRFLNFLIIREEEQLKIVLMLIIGFFMGVFISSYTVTAESLFISNLSDQLNRAFLVSGILGVWVTFLFTSLQSRIKFSTITVWTIMLIIASSSGLLFLYHHLDKAQSDIVLFGMFCLIGPYSALLLLCYWGIFGRIFNFRQSKKIIGWIDTGQLIAFILTNFLIPIATQAFVYFQDTANFLEVANGGLLIVLLTCFFMYQKFDLVKNNPKELPPSVRRESRLVAIMKDNYVLSLSLFLIVSMSLLMLGQYSFQTVLNKQYPQQQNLASFLGYFNGTLFTLSLLMQTFINDRIMSNFGIRVALLILPILTFFFATLAIGVPPLLEFFSGSSEDTFLFFFLMIALMRLFNGMLRDSLESPLFKLLFIPLDDRLRFTIQAKVEGIVSETGRLVAGLFLFTFSLFSFFTVTVVLVLLLVLCGLHILLSGKLYQGYRNKIRLKLESSGFQGQRLDVGLRHLTDRLGGILADTKISRVIFSFRLLEKINPAQMGQWINRLMKNNSDDIRDFAQDRMNELKGLSVSDSYVIRMTIDDPNKKVLSRGELELLFSRGGDITKTRIQKLARSPEYRDRQYAAELVLNSTAEESMSYLIELLNDSDERVRHTAIISATKKNNHEVIFALIDNLINPTFSNQAMNALAQVGERALPYLESAFYRSGQYTQTMIRIVQILGRIGGHKAQELLWNKIDYPDKVIVSQVLVSMGESGFKAGVSQASRIRFAIESDIADICWNLGAIQEVGNHASIRQVRQALLMEIHNDTEHIYMLLAMLYDTGSIQLIKEIVESGTSEGITYAIELLDIFLPEQLKQRVIPVIDDLSVAEKSNKLEIYYPRIKLDEKLVLKFLINRDFTQTNRWTKACVLVSIGSQKIKDFILDLVAQFFNPDKLIREAAGWALYQIHPALYFQHVERLDEKTRKELDSVICPDPKTKRPEKLMLFEKVLFLQKAPMFEGVQGLTLAMLADIAVETTFKGSQTIDWSERSKAEFFMLYAGQLHLSDDGQREREVKPGDFIGEGNTRADSRKIQRIHITSEARILCFPKDPFYELLSNDVKLADKVLDFV